MKKLIMICAVFYLSSFCLAEMPKDIKLNIEQQARDMYDDAKDAKDFIDWQENSYNTMQKRLVDADIPQEEKDKIRFYLRGKYGINFIKQNADVVEEINRIRESEEKLKISTQKAVEQIMNEKNLAQIEEKINIEAKESLKEIYSEEKIPAELMERFKKEAERLYPKNSYEQLRYVESSIENFKFYKELLMKNRK